ncbi:MAG: DEAD/DEAH box helicase [Pseudomonadota bacterium]|nr:DEAD/DEAH box helicase [Pseudomonadota bacterium]
MHFTLSDIRQNFDSGTFGRGQGYARSGKVRKLKLADGGAQIDSTVSGSGSELYRQSIKVTQRSGVVRLKGACSCPMQSNCKHVVAVLLRCLEQQHGEQPGVPAQPAEPGLPFALSAWMAQAQEALQAARAPSVKASKAAQQLMYVLIPDRVTGRTNVHLCKARVRANGAVVSATLIPSTYSLYSDPPAYVGSADLFAMRLYDAMSSRRGYGEATEPQDDVGAHFLRTVLGAGRLGWAEAIADLKTGTIDPIKAGPRRAGMLAWRAGGEGARSLRLAWQFADGDAIDCVLPLEPPMYVEQGLLGELILGDALHAMPLKQLRSLVALAPAVAVRDVPALARQLTARGLGQLLPAPQASAHASRTDIAPRPFLLMGSRPREVGGNGPPHWQDYATLAFDYDGERVPAGATQQIVRHTAAGTEVIVRDAALEVAAETALAALGFRAPAAADAAPGALELARITDWVQFVRHELPQLQERGWLTEQGADFRFDLAEVDDWYADVKEGGEAGSAWFDLELGIVVNGARVALLPVLLQLIRSAPQDFDAAALERHLDSDQLIARLPDGVNVALPWSRVKPILATLGELYFNDRVGASLRLPALDAARLAALEASAQLRWMGGERLRDTGRKLLSFDGIAPVAAPAGLQASLRPYQNDGLAWMQFLRAYQLAGILADDMGLGKTIQTLAHILVEKEAGRLSAPALVVAPTSLMGNWQTEAARFAPGLRVLLLHGAGRQARFDQIGRHDLVLTTYALLARDEAALCAQRFHLLILDESQYIKNSRSKAAQTAALLPATHRLCLTGTPLQNHLGELWAQFHFLMPGLLGDEKRFNADFRKPIEKLGDAARNGFLVRRIKPFLLRRTKDAVAKELPAKTEMVREVELSGAQRDLYETVRLAMDRKVREAIASKGVARSQIIILDALLKLRQVCCDPRLVKGHAGRGAASAKLDELMEMVIELLAEGRKILVFSQFTSMLALIEAELDARRIAYALLTGDTKDRAGQVAAFQHGAVPIFLISLKAGGVGLNLTAADTVIHYDPWWNPAAENQATDRAWRIGQDKPVFVYKLIAKGTLEQKIQQLQHKKAALADAVLAGGAADDLALTAADLQAILAPL